MRTHKYLAIVLLSLLASTSAWAQKNEWLSPFSPGLRKFLTDRPENYQVLTNILTEAFTNRTVRFYYFYTQDESVPRAEHFYPDVWEVCVTIEANQKPADELLSIIFESLNSEGEKRFAELADEAQSGSISKTNYALEVVRQEFVAVKRTRDLLGKLTLTKQEISSSHFYKRFSGTPERFEDFLAYLKKVNTKRRDLIEQYEERYDLIRNPESTTNTPPP
jgi:hypothetical protein